MPEQILMEIYPIVVEIQYFIQDQSCGPINNKVQDAASVDKTIRDKNLLQIYAWDICYDIDGMSRE